MTIFIVNHYQGLKVKLLLIKYQQLRLYHNQIKKNNNNHNNYKIKNNKSYKWRLLKSVLQIITKQMNYN